MRLWYEYEFSKWPSRRLRPGNLESEAYSFYAKMSKNFLEPTNGFRQQHRFVVTTASELLALKETKKKGNTHALFYSL